MRTPRRLAALLLLTATHCLLSPSVHAIEHTVYVQDHSFDAGGGNSSLEINIGDSVKWVWLDSGHDVEGGSGGISNGTFSSGGLRNPGYEMIVLFDETFVDQNPVIGDVYNYFCTPHYEMGMTGSVRVLYRRKDFSANATGWQVVPPNENPAEVACTLTVNETETQISYSCGTLAGVESGGLYIGALGDQGTALTGCTFSTFNPPSGSCATDSDTVTSIIEGNAYIELRTSDSALRGQLTIEGGSFSVFGRVSLQSSQGVEGAQLSAGNHTILSGENGYFEFEDMPNGVYLIVGTLEGYEIEGLPGINPFMVNNAPVYNRLFIASEPSEEPPLLPADYAPLDFDGDGLSDPTTLLSDAAEGLIQRMRTSQSGGTSTALLGSSAINAVSADYDGDGVSDTASVMQHGTMLHWTIASSASQSDLEYMFGEIGDKLLSGCDFSGDGADDLAVIAGNRLTFREALTDAQSEVALAGVARILKASCGDVNGDGRDELLVQEKRKGGSAKRARSKKRSDNQKVRAIDVQSGAALLSLRVTNPKHILAPDLNRDGKAELAAIVPHKQKGKLRLEGRAEGSARKIQLTLPNLKAIIAGKFEASDSSVQPGILYQNPAGSVYSMNFLDNTETFLFALEAGEELLKDRILRPVQ